MELKRLSRVRTLSCGPCSEHLKGGRTSERERRRSLRKGLRTRGSQARPFCSGAPPVGERTMFNTTGPRGKRACEAKWRKRKGERRGTVLRKKPLPRSRGTHGLRVAALWLITQQRSAPRSDDN